MHTIRPKPFLYHTLFLIVFTLNVFVFCEAQNLPFIFPSDKQGLVEVRLGTSNYYLLLPDNFEISEARGKEGQLGYDIIPKDTSSTMLGFIEIQRGNPIGGNLYNDTTFITFAESLLDNKKAKWKIAASETGYYLAHTSESGDLNALVSSRVRTEIDSLISIIATLKEK